MFVASFIALFVSLIAWRLFLGLSFSPSLSLSSHTHSTLCTARLLLPPKCRQILWRVGDGRGYFRPPLLILDSATNHSFNRNYQI